MTCLGPEGSDPRDSVLDAYEGGDLLGQAVMDAYDGGVSTTARIAAIDVLADSRKALLETAGQAAAMRESLSAALKSALQWLDLLTPVSNVPGMEQMRHTLRQAEIAPAVRVSHGICVSCVGKVFPQMLDRVMAKLAKAPLTVSSDLVTVCSYCGSAIKQRGGN